MIFNSSKRSFDPALIPPMKYLWEWRPDLPAAAIAERFSVTKNTVIGQADRRGWKPRKEQTKESSTTFTRLDALNAKLDAVLAETRPYVEDRPKVNVAA